MLFLTLSKQYVITHNNTLQIRHTFNNAFKTIYIGHIELVVQEEPNRLRINSSKGFHYISLKKEDIKASLEELKKQYPALLVKTN